MKRYLFLSIVLAAWAAWAAWVVVPDRIAPLWAQDHKGHGDGHDEGDDHDDGDDDHKVKGEKVTLTGEIVDLHCFLLHPDSGQGAKHAKCATACMNKGLPIGLWSGERVYLLLGQGHDSVKGQAAPQAGKKIEVQGTRFQRYGMWVIQVESIGKGKPKDDHPKGDHPKGDGHDGHGGH